MADDTQQREADDREYEDLDDLEALEGGAEVDDESSPEAEGEEDESTGGTEEDDDDVVTLDDDELPQASLEQLRDQRTARKRLDLDEDEDLLALVSDTDLPDADLPDAEAAPARVTPIESRQEFVCARCRLVKPRVQLADPARGLCRDCA